MGEVVQFPERKNRVDFKVTVGDLPNKEIARQPPCGVTPEILSQMVFWDEWERAVITLQRRDETVTLCSDPSLRRNHMMVDMAKLSLLMQQESDAPK